MACFVSRNESSDRLLARPGRQQRFVISNDVGITWTPWPSGTEAGLRGVAFADSINGWAVGEGGTILKFEPR